MSASLENNCNPEAENFITFINTIKNFNSEHSAFIKNIRLISNKILESIDRPQIGEDDSNNIRNEARETFLQKERSIKDQEKCYAESDFEKLWSDNKKILGETGLVLVYNSNELLERGLSNLLDEENNSKDSLGEEGIYELSFELEEDIINFDYLDSAKQFCNFIDKFSESDFNNLELRKAFSFIISSLNDQFLKKYIGYLKSTDELNTLEEVLTKELEDITDDIMEKFYQGVKIISDKFEEKGLPSSISAYLDNYDKGILKEYLIADSAGLLSLGYDFSPHNWHIDMRYETYKKNWNDIFKNIELIKENNRAVKLIEYIYDKLSDCIACFENDSEKYSNSENYHIAREYKKKADFINSNIKKQMHDLAIYISARSDD